AGRPAMARSGRILVVDDEANARSALAELLHDEGFDVETSADAFKALGKYEAFAPHIVITDLKMPGMDGIELVKRIRAMEEPAADAIHQGSPRANGPFIKLHCAALAENLLESELFGHDKGAFTGAVSRKDGRFSLADGGTLFLDEIGEISPALQVKLLRFLQ